MEKVIDNGTITRDIGNEETFPVTVVETYQKIRLQDNGAILYDGENRIFVPYFQIQEIIYKEEKPDFDYD